MLTRSLLIGLVALALSFGLTLAQNVTPPPEMVPAPDAPPPPDGTVPTPAADEPPSMVKIVFRNMTPSVAGTAAAKPVEFYICGASKARIEQSVDSANKSHSLIIVDGKNSWYINLYNHTGQHSVDPGPTYEFYAPIIDDPNINSKTLANFCFGHEMEFMQMYKVVPQSLPATATREARNFFQTIQDGVAVRVYTSAASGKPVEVEAYKGSTLLGRLMYDSFDEVPVNASLFAPPSDVKLTEIKPSDAKK